MTERRSKSFGIKEREIEKNENKIINQEKYLVLKREREIEKIENKVTKKWLILNKAA